ncbi:hypothetical protein KUTeg_019002 [Tegillarca granosa]|uniref:GBD/FH3 domain-containing protein n=1 Tax=Tegillarca granosa TaxID=220873 RepID=A0ABQ9EFH5_TEGGR|nr:hypothetical protein KUTeg_019002 [Tegillarca granosa]
MDQFCIMYRRLSRDLGSSAPSYDRGYGSLSSSRSHGSLYDNVGTSIPSTNRYGAGSGNYGSNYLSTSYGSSKPSYSGTSGYQPSSQRNSLYGGSSSVRDKIQQFSPSESRSHSMYTPLGTRNTTDSYGRDNSKYSSRSAGSDPYGSKSGYLSDYGSSSRSYGSWDRASSRSGRSYGGASRETSPVSYASSASPYNTYKSGSEPSPPITRKYDRQVSRDSDYSSRRPRDDYYDRRKSREYIPPPPRRKVSVSTESDTDDSAPEAEKEGFRGKYLISRGTSPINETENTKRDSRYKKDKAKTIAKTKRIHKEPKRESRYRESRLPGTVDCAVQTNMEPTGVRRSRRGQGGGGGGDGVDNAELREKATLAALAMLQGTDADDNSKSFNEIKEKFSNESNPHYTSYNEVCDAPQEKSWRKAVYGDSDTEGGKRRPPQPRTSTPKSTEVYNGKVNDDKPSSRRERRSQGSDKEKRRSQGSDKDSRPGYSRSSSRESILDDRPRRRRHGSKELLDQPEVVVFSPEHPQAPPRRRRHGSKELLDDHDDKSAPLTPENLQLRESIDKVHSWKKRLSPSDPYYDEAQHNTPSRHLETGFPRSDSGEYFSAHDYAPSKSSKQSERSRDDSPDRSRSNDGRGHLRRPMRQDSVHDESPPYSRDASPNRGRHKHRHMESDTVFYTAEDDQDPRLPKKDFRKSQLNRGEIYENGDNGYEERGGHHKIRRQDSHGLHQQKQQNRHSSSDAFSRDDSPNRLRHGSRQSSVEKSRLKRNSSREDILDDKRASWEHERGNGSDSSHVGFNKEGSPNRPIYSPSKRRTHSRQNSREGIIDDGIRRQSSREDILDDRTDYPKHRQSHGYDRPRSLGVSNESLAHMSNVGSVPSINSVGPDDGRLQNSNSMNSVVSNEMEAQHPMDEDRHKRRARKTRSAVMNNAPEYDSFIDFDRHEEEMDNRGRRRDGQASERRLRSKKDYYNADSKDIDEAVVQRPQNLMDTPVPKHPHPLRPHPNVPEDKLVDIEPHHISPVGAPPSPNAPGKKSPSAPNKKKPAVSEACQRMHETLTKNKGSVTIEDILDICTRPHQQRVIRVPGVTGGESDVNFRGYSNVNELLESMGVDVKKLEDCALQIYRYHNGSQGDYSTYLDLESTIDEQEDDLEGFQDQKKNALILRTQLTVRVHAVIEKLLNSYGRELRRALFSLKQIFQDDKDLVHEFVNNDGLDCLIKVGSEADQNYQNYILRALGQVMLYVDGMNGVIAHNATIQWLYSLLSSKFRLVVKTALKLLLVFVEYTESNTPLLLKAINAVDAKKGSKPWSNIMGILDEKDGGDTELLVYAMTLVNKVLNAIPDQDTFYDVVDAMEELGMERVTNRHMNRNGADLDLLTQFQIYEASIMHEDGEEDDEVAKIDSLRRTPRIKSDADGERKSRRYSMGTGPKKAMQKSKSVPALKQEEDVDLADQYRDKKLKNKE